MRSHWKKLLSAFLAIIMVMGLFVVMPTTALAASSIVYESPYDLYDYFTNWKEYDVTLDGNTVVLQEDINLEDIDGLIYISEAGDDLEVILDLNGKKITGNVGMYYVLGVEKGILTITDRSTSGKGLIENKSTDSGIALGVQKTGRLNIKGGKTDAEFGIIVGGGSCYVSGGEVSAEVNGILVTGGDCNISGGKINTGGHTVSASGGTLTLSNKFSLTATNWDGVHADGVDVVFKDVTDGTISGGKYGVSAINANIVFENTKKCQIDGKIAAVMIEAKNDKYSLQLKGTSVNAEAGDLVSTTFADRDNPLCTSFSTSSTLMPVFWTDRFADPVLVVSGTKSVALSAEVVAAPPEPSLPSLDDADDWAKAELTAAFEAGIVPPAVADAGWKNATSRLAAAEAMVVVIEKATGKTMSQIASERGWDLATGGFSDTDSQEVTFLKYAKVTNGVGDNRYDPLSNYTRAQMVTMIGRAAEGFFGATAQGENPFSDVPDWAAPYVGYAADNKITTGVGGGLFDSNGVLQNQHTAVFCIRAFNVWA